MSVITAVQVISAPQQAYVTSLALRLGQSPNPAKVAALPSAQYQQVKAKLNTGLSFAMRNKGHMAPAKFQLTLLAAIAHYQGVTITTPATAGEADRLLVAWFRKANSTAIMALAAHVNPAPACQCGQPVNNGHVCF